MKLSKINLQIIKIILIVILSNILIKCATRQPYKPYVMPTGKGELKKKQIRRDFTN